MMAANEARGLGLGHGAGAGADRLVPAHHQAMVLMSCRVSEGIGRVAGMSRAPGPRPGSGSSSGSSSGSGLAAAAAAAGGEHSVLRLQLSMERPGEFRLGVRYNDSRLGKSLSLYEFNLRDIVYEFKSATCHGISTRTQPADQLTFHFEDEKEAQKWSTIVSSSLREVEKASSAAAQQNHTSITGATLQSTRPVTEGATGAEPRAGPDTPRPGMDTARTEDLILRLAQAIQAGDTALSSECAVTLAQQKVCLGIRLKETAYPTRQISVRVGVEDATSSATIITKVFPYATVSTLKQQVFRDFGFHPVVQRWIIGQCLAVDHRTLSSYGVKKDGDSAFLYLLSAKLATLPRLQYEEDQALAVMTHGETLTDMLRRESLVAEEKRKYSTLPTKLPVNKGRVPPKDRDGRMDISNIAQCLNLELKSLQPLPSQEAQSRPSQQTTTVTPPTQNGWACEKCTYINKPSRPGCEMCSSPRPPEYSVPEQYAPDDEELRRILQEKEAMLRYQQEKGRRDEWLPTCDMLRLNLAETDKPPFYD